MIYSCIYIYKDRHVCLYMYLDKCVCRAAAWLWMFHDQGSSALSGHWHVTPGTLVKGLRYTIGNRSFENPGPECVSFLPEATSFDP